MAVLSQRLCLDAHPVDRLTFWRTLLLGAAPMVVVYFLGPLITPFARWLWNALFLVFNPLTFWVVLSPWIMRLYANRLIDLGKSPIWAPLTFGFANLIVVLGALPLFVPDIYWNGSAAGGDGMAAGLLLVFSMMLTAAVWLVFTLVVGTQPSAKRQKATTRELQSQDEV